MNVLQITLKRAFHLFLIFNAFIVFSVLQSCKTENKSENGITSEPEVKDDFIEIVTVDMDFQMPDTIPSGFNKFVYKNLSPQTHFFLIDKYPEGKTAEDAEKVIGPIFNKGIKLIMDGKSEEGFKEFSNLPEWFHEVKFLGGSGLISPNKTAETTLYLEPGNYLFECYVKMPNGMVHMSMGMLKNVVVSEKKSGVEEPEADIDIEISSSEGIVFTDTISAGKHTFSVYFKDQKVHENFVGHDVNIVKLEENANLDELEIWMNWAEPKGLIEPAPENIVFLGGVNDMPTGSKAYFTATLEEGNYALISEVPNASTKNMFKKFVVSK